MAIDVVNNAKVVATKNNYRDLDLLFKAHPITGDVTTRSDIEAVKRAVKNIILTNNYERPFKPGFGGSIRDLLFELNTARKIRKVEKRIVDMLETFEPRISNIQVRVGDTDTNAVNMQVFYTIKNTERKQEVDFKITRAR
jgi:phage baseplate assembly protein W